MSFRKVSAGDPHRPSARLHNALVDLLSGSRKAGRPSRSAGMLPQRVPYCRNDTGQPLSRFSVVRLSGIVIDPEANLDQFQLRPLFEGALPDDAEDDPWGIVQEPISADQYGAVVLTGLTPALVDVTSEDHRFVEPVHEESAHLVSATSGQAEIIYREGGTGIQWTLIRFGAPGGETTCKEIHQLYVTGDPGGGYAEIQYSIPDQDGDLVTETITLDWNATATNFRVALEGHSEIAPQDIECYGGPWPFIALEVEFQGRLSGIVIPEPILSVTFSNEESTLQMRRLKTAR